MSALNGVAVVVGAATGLGRAMAARSAESMTTCIADQTALEICDAGARRLRWGDVTHRASVSDLARRVDDELGRASVLHAPENRNVVTARFANVVAGFDDADSFSPRS
jgi:NAD(P)-dependent dehydrogenase (short-subunit alcohol dehydrogenase family)